MTTDTMERTDILDLAEEQNATALYTDAKQFDALVESIRSVIGDKAPDMSVKDDRERVRSIAAKIAKVKTRVDEAGKTVKDDAQKRVDEINGFRRRYKETLQGIQDEVRAPLTKWEEAEKVRQEKTAAIMQDFTDAIANPFTAERTVERMEDRLNAVEAIAIDPELFGDQAEHAEERKAKAIETVRASLETVRKEEADRAELERLRKAEAERAEQDRLAAEKREREEREAEERKAQQAEHVENMIQHIKSAGMGFIGGEPQAPAILLYELTDKIVIDDSFGERKAEAEQARKEALELIEKAVAEGRERREREEAERAKRQAEEARAEERQRIEREQREKDEAEAKARESEERKARNKQHRDMVMTKARHALVTTAGLSASDADAALLAIADGAVPHVTIQY